MSQPGRRSKSGRMGHSDKMNKSGGWFVLVAWVYFRRMGQPDRIGQLNKISKPGALCLPDIQSVF
jgi:hypothetical protein